MSGLGGWLLDLAGHSPAVQVTFIVLATFVLEDAATVMAALLAQSGAISISLALISLYAGIVLGDLGLYGIGALSGYSDAVARWIPQSKRRPGTEWLQNKVFRVVFISRFVPGARLPTYTACGFLHASLARFTMATVLATTIWTSLLFTLSLRLGALILSHLGVWRWVGAVGFVVVLLLMGRMAVRLQESRR
jgi:membrane protein DedA with SNARE-associated domain